MLRSPALSGSRTAHHSPVSIWFPICWLTWRPCCGCWWGGPPPPACCNLFPSAAASLQAGTGSPWSLLFWNYITGSKSNSEATPPSKPLNFLWQTMILESWSQAGLELSWCFILEESEREKKGCLGALLCYAISMIIVAWVMWAGWVGWVALSCIDTVLAILLRHCGVKIEK